MELGSLLTGLRPLLLLATVAVVLAACARSRVENPKNPRRGRPGPSGTSMKRLRFFNETDRPTSEVLQPSHILVWHASEPIEPPPNAEHLVGTHDEPVPGPGELDVMLRAYPGVQTQAVRCRFRIDGYSTVDLSVLIPEPGPENSIESAIVRVSKVPKKLLLVKIQLEYWSEAQGQYVLYDVPPETYPQ